MRARGVLLGFCSAAALGIAGQTLHATPYASGVQKTGTSVSFILNEPADTLTYSINGGAPVSLDGTTKGTKTFTLGSATDKFSIVAEKNAATGYTIPTGNVSPPVFGTAGDYSTLKSLSQPTNEAGYNLISDDANLFTKYNSPRGVSVSRDANAPNFGTVYISNSATPATFAARPGLQTAADGLYALHSDQSDAYGYGDTAQNPNTTTDNLPAFSTASTSSPYRLHVAKDGTVYDADWADVNSNAFALNPNLTSATNLFQGYDGTTGTATGDGTSLPVGQNHGSIAAIYTEGSLATGDLTVYTIDEDLTSAHVSGNPADPQNDRNSLWKYTIGSGPLPVSTMPTKVFGGPDGILGTITTGGVTVDMDRGADGKFYVSQQRTAGNEPGLIVVDPSTGTKVWDSLATSRTLLSDPAAHDIITTLTQIAISPDDKYLAGMLNFSQVLVLPLVNGIPDLANRSVVNTPTPVNSGRDIAFDAADNIHYVSSGQGVYRVLTPGGHTLTTLSFDGTTYAFTNSNVVANDADFNNDGKVDGADFLIWQRGQGGAGNNGAGDANGDGQVNAADLAAWKAAFGGSATAAVAGVPEPGSLCLLAFAGMFGLAARGRRSA